MFWPWMKRLKWFCPVLPPALFQEQQASCLNVNMFVCLMHGYIFLLYVYLLNKDGCWEICCVNCFTLLISRTDKCHIFLSWLQPLLCIRYASHFRDSFLKFGDSPRIPMKLPDSCAGRHQTLEIRFLAKILQTPITIMVNKIHVVWSKWKLTHRRP